MILTCPECATSYFADESAIGEGRTVRCGSCGAAWRVQGKAPLELRVGSQEGVHAAGSEAGDEALFERPSSELPGDMLPKAFRARAESERRMREAAVQGAIWAGMGSVVALMLVTAVVFRTDVVRLWPRSASAYAAVHLAVNPVGLTIEDLHARPSLQDGHPALLVSGVLRNIRARTIQSPPLSIVLRDKANHLLLHRIVPASDPQVPPGQTRKFVATLVDPPGAAANVGVEFALDREGRALPAETPTPVSVPKLRTIGAEPQAMMIGPAQVQDARPLPSSSPYALSGADRGSAH